MSKKIAIFGWKVGDNSFGITVPYYNYISQFGEVHILSLLREVDYSLYDLLVVPGGPDVNPVTYGYIPSLSTGFSDPIREYYDEYLIPQAIAQQIPIVGICRGHQSIAVRFGSTLIQDMYHKTNNSRERNALVHELDVHIDSVPEALMEKLRTSLSAPNRVKEANRRSQSVNSLHHQIVRNIPDEAVLLATHYHKDDKADYSIEALYYPNHNIFTFQYHPEEIYDALSIECIKYLLNKVEVKNEPREKREVSELNITP